MGREKSVTPPATRVTDHLALRRYHSAVADQL
jgi:hypothetical protein